MGNGIDGECKGQSMEDGGNLRKDVGQGLMKEKERIEDTHALRPWVKNTWVVHTGPFRLSKVKQIRRGSPLVG